MKREERRKEFNRQLSNLGTVKGVAGIDGDVVLLGRTRSGQNTWYVLETHDISKNRKQVRAAVTRYNRWLTAWQAKKPRGQSN